MMLLMYRLSLLSWPRSTGAGRGFCSALADHADSVAWSGFVRPQTVVRTRFAGDAEATLASVDTHSAVDDLVADLAAAVRRHADLDSVFRDEIRQFVVEAHADPTTE
jgi:hypothetical protein